MYVNTHCIIPAPPDAPAAAVGAVVLLHYQSNSEPHRYWLVIQEERRAHREATKQQQLLLFEGWGYRRHSGHSAHQCLQASNPYREIKCRHFERSMAVPEPPIVAAAGVVEWPYAADHRSAASASVSSDAVSSDVADVSAPSFVPYWRVQSVNICSSRSLTDGRVTDMLLRRSSCSGGEGRTKG